MKRQITLLTFIFALSLLTGAQTAVEEPADSLDLEMWDELSEVTVVQRMSGIRRLRGSALNTEVVSAGEMKRAACCNLGESFTTNPSVDVNYSDAATGARQIKLLGLPGTYVQMLTENIPSLRGAGALYGLGYIPGPWMQSIQVSKGASSVKNGYESVTGQINIEMLKPQAEPSLALNGYVDLMRKAEANAMGNLSLGGNLSTGLLLHAENSFATHDENHDGFADAPRLRQLSAMNRWAWVGESYIFQAALRYLDEKRLSGQTDNHHNLASSPDLYTIDIRTHRGEAWMKNAYIFDPDNGGNVALILSGSLHDQKGLYGHRVYDVYQRNFYASLMFERDFGQWHSLSAGLSLNMDDYRQHFRLSSSLSDPVTPWRTGESVAGGYAQYTFNYQSQLLLMGGIRYDRSTRYGSMFTPRFHARWNVSEPLSINLSAGKGYRTPYVLVDNSPLLASSRRIVWQTDLPQEEAWNFGGGLSGIVSLFGNTLNWNAEYYYTRFLHQMVVDLDGSSSLAYIRDIAGRSYSHSAQIELTYTPHSDLTLTAAYRFNDVRADYGHGLVTKPLTSRSKGLISASYAPMMGLWQFDLTLAINGSGRMPDAPLTDGQPLWNTTYKAFPTLNAQITREFRHWSIYLGGENLTNYRQPHPIIGASDPWGSSFDATMVYGPVQGAMAYIGFRYHI